MTNRNQEFILRSKGMSSTQKSILFASAFILAFFNVLGLIFGLIFGIMIPNTKNATITGAIACGVVMSILAATILTLVGDWNTTSTAFFLVFSIIFWPGSAAVITAAVSKFIRPFCVETGLISGR